MIDQGARRALSRVSGLLMWAGKNRNQHTLGRFFDDLGAQRAAALTHICADGAEWIHTVVKKIIGVAVRTPGERAG